jgi:hypothetical protein
LCSPFFAFLQGNEYEKAHIDSDSRCWFWPSQRSQCGQEALNTIGREDVEIVVLNTLVDKRSPIFLRASQRDYDKLIARAAELYRLGYEASDTTASSVFLEGALTVMLFDVMRDVLRKFRPNVIISTYPLYQAPLISLFALYKISIPLLRLSPTWPRFTGFGLTAAWTA